MWARLIFSQLRAAVAGLVRCVQRLRHDTFVAGRERCFVERAGGGLRGGDQSRNAHASPVQRRERFEALARGAVRDAAPVEIEAVEKVSPDGQVARAVASTLSLRPKRRMVI